MMMRSLSLGACCVLGACASLWAEEAPTGRFFSGFDLTFGARVKADGSYDDSNAYPGEYILYVNPEGGSNVRNNDEFNMTAKETRLWFNLAAPGADWVKPTGRVEFDFYGSAGTANKGNVLLRHAFANLDFPKVGISCLMGQTSDIISPLVCHTLNYTVGWDQGNIGYRRPQLRLTKTQAIGDVELVGVAGITRSIDADALTSAISVENGETTGVPTAQGRVGLTMPFLFEQRASIGASGHWGYEDITRATPAPSRTGEFQSWSFNLDVTLPITQYVTLTGEYFVGENLDTYFGGIGQGVDLDLFTEIRSQGGWVQAKVKPHADWEINIGYGLDDPRNSDLSSGKRDFNDAVYTNVRYTVIKGATVGIEYGHYRTDYRGGPRADDNRVQFSMILTF